MSTNNMRRGSGLFSLPLKMGGLSVWKPRKQKRIFSWNWTKKSHKRKVEEDERLERLTAAKRQSVNLAFERGAINWLNVLPLTKYGFILNKSEFRDGLLLRYGIEPRKLPETYPLGPDFTIAHAVHCPKGVYTNLRHNEIRDTIAKFMNDVCSDVEIDHLLQPLQGKSFDN